MTSHNVFHIVSVSTSHMKLMSTLCKVSLCLNNSENGIQ